MPSALPFVSDEFFDAAAIVDVMNLSNSEHAPLFVPREHPSAWASADPRHNRAAAWSARSYPPLPRRAAQSRAPRGAGHPVISSRFRTCGTLDDGNHLFMRGDLKHAVTRRVDDRLAVRTCSSPSSLMISVPDAGLFSNRLPANLLLELFDQLFREAVLVNRETPGPKPNSRPFPSVPS